MWSCLLSASLYGDSPPQHDFTFQEASNYPNLPWLTGTLLTPSEVVVPGGHWNVEPYLAWDIRYGYYDSKWNYHHASQNFYSLISINYLEYGISDYVDVQIAPQLAWNHTSGASQWVLGDLSVIFDFQLLYAVEGKWWPNVKLTVSGDIPIGKYQHLDPHKKGTDGGGTGSFNPSAGIVFGRVFQLSTFHFFRPRLFMGYTIPNSVSVKGLNVYGGGVGTKGVVYPSQVLLGLTGLEYTLNPHWVFSLDVQYAHKTKQQFKGKTEMTMRAPSSEQWSLAPAVEYNWSENLGLISGVWFSLAGRNATSFASGISALNVYF